MLMIDFIKLRDALTDIAYRNNAFVSSIASETIGSEAYGSVQIDGIGVSYDGTNYTFRNGNDNVLTILKTDIQDRLSDVIPNTSYSVSDLLATSSNTGDVYSLLSTITQKFSYTNRVSLTNLNAMIDGIKADSSLNYNISDLKNQLLSITDDNGYVTGRSWILSVQEWMKSCNDKAEEESPELDNTAPNTLSGVYNIVADIIQSVVSIIFSAMAAVFGGILSIIGGLISKIFGMLSDYFHSGGDIDPDCPNMFTKGVAIATEKQISDYPPLWNLTKDDYSINYVNSDSLGLFFWQGSDQNKGRFNAYIEPHISVEAAAQYVLDCEASPAFKTIQVQRDIYNNVSSISKTSNQVSDNINIGMTDEQKLKASMDLATYSCYVCVSEFIRFIRSAPYKYFESGAWRNNRFFMTTVPNVWTNLPVPAQVIWFGACHVLNYINHNDPFYFVEVDANKTIALVSQYVMYLYERRDRLHQLDWYTRYDTTYGVGIGGPLNPLIRNNFTDIMTTSSCLDGFGYEIVYSDGSMNPGYVSWYAGYTGNYYKANSLPTSFMTSYNGVSLDNFVKALIITSLLAISAAFVTTKVCKAIRLKKIKKQALRSKDIAQAKDAWLADPDNSELLNTYAHKVDSYNRLGKILGWGSYDAANGWFNNAKNGNSVPSSTPNLLSIAAKAKDTLTNTTNLGTDLTKLSTSLAEVPTNITTFLTSWDSFVETYQEDIRGIKLAIKAISDLIYKP